MIKALKIFFFLNLLIHLSSCEKSILNDCYKGRGEQVEITRGLGPIKSIDFNLAAKLFITYDNQLDRPELKILGQKNVIDLIRSDINDFELEIEFMECIKSHSELVFYLKTPYLESVTLSGPGALYSQNALVAEKIVCENTSVGQMELICDAFILESKINGPGSLRIDGRTKTQIFESNAGGNYSAFGLESDTTTIRINSTGNASVVASDTLRAIITGNGDIRYLGRPGVFTEITGNGKLIDAN